MGFDITGLGSAFDFAKTITNKFFSDKMSDADRAKAQIDLQEMIDSRDSSLIESKKEIMVAELNQGDYYTKRARPTVVYAGLCFIAIVHVIFPIIAFVTGKSMPELSLPEEFWWTWGGICSAWVLGRSAEKRGASNKIVSAITGK